MTVINYQSCIQPHFTHVSGKRLFCFVFYASVLLSSALWQELCDLFWSQNWTLLISVQLLLQQWGHRQSEWICAAGAIGVFPAIYPFSLPKFLCRVRWPLAYIGKPCEIRNFQNKQRANFCFLCVAACKKYYVQKLGCHFKRWLPPYTQRESTPAHHTHTFLFQVTL